MWSLDDKGAGSGLIWETVKRQLGPEKSISRALVIVAMNRFGDQGVFGFRDATGKEVTTRSARETRGFQEYSLGLTSPSGLLCSLGTP